MLCKPARYRMCLLAIHYCKEWKNKTQNIALFFALTVGIG